jgi:hypothetical protein
MAKSLPLHPAHPERICWGCDKYCAADELRCGNGSIRSQHPLEIFGEDWLEQSLESETRAATSIEGLPSPLRR